MAFPWLAITISAAFTFLGQLLSKKPKQKPTDLEGFQVPTATEDRPKPYFVGTVRHRSPNCTWYGDYSTKAIKNKVSALQGVLSLGSAYMSKQVIGYKYFLGFDLNLGWGELDELLRITMNDKVAWEGSASSGTLTIDKPTLFGGEDENNSQNGGFQGRVVVYPGDGAQDADAYVVAKSGATPAYRHDVHLVFKGLGSGGAYVGNVAAIPEISVDMRRCPNQLGVTGGKHIIDTYDANPVCALYEFLIRPKNHFGGGYSPVQFNTDNWIAAAEQVYAEGLGVSRLIDQVGEVDRVVDDYLQLIDGVININMTTGKFEIVLARNDYDPDAILELGDDDIVDIVSYKRGAWIETWNEVKLSYIDRTQNFESIPIAAQDGANSSGQAEVRSTTIKVEGVSNPDTANLVLWRELKVMSTPLATLGLKVNRKGFNLYGGAVFKYTGTRIARAQGLIFRVASVDAGAPTANAIEIRATQDIYSLVSTAFLPPQPTGWTPPSTVAANIVDARAIEQPYFFHGSDDTLIFTVAKPANGAQLSYDLHTHEASDPYVLRVNRAPFTPTGVLADDYTSTAYNTSGQLKVTPEYGMDDLPDEVAPSDIALGRDGLLIINDEILAYESYTVDGDGNYVFDGVWGGLLDTILAEHDEDDRVWFISDAATIDFTRYTSGATVKAKLASRGSDGAFPLASCTEFTV